MGIRSMTGYGEASEAGTSRVVRVELRSVNHRYADIRLRLPAELAAQEGEIRRGIQSRMQRGRVEAAVSVAPAPGAAPRQRLDEGFLEELIVAVERVRSRLGSAEPLGLDTALSVPGMFRVDPSDTAWGAGEQAAFDRALRRALDALDGEREREGRHLGQELDARLRRMIVLTREMRERAAAVPAAVRSRLVERLRAVAPEVAIDPGRLAQEAVLLADRCDVTEELVRLEAHLAQCVSLVAPGADQPIGRRMEFLVQEIQREANTVHSKAQDVALAGLALDLRSEADRVREQVQNVE